MSRIKLSVAARDDLKRLFHKRYENIDTNLVARIIHQKACYDAHTIGLTEK